MKRTLFTTSVSLVVLFACIMLFIRAQPYQDGGLGTFLRPPDGCPAPCWSGIRPGETTMTNSGKLLKNNLHVKTIEAISPTTAWLRFSANIPLVQRVRVNLWEENRGIVGRIELLNTGLSLSELQLLLGAPTRIILSDSREYGTSVLTALYPLYDVYVTVTIPRCATSPSHFWQETDNAAISLGHWQNFGQLYSSYYHPSVELDPHRWTMQLSGTENMPMICLLLKLAFPLWVLFTLPVLLIRAQPYDDSELRAFLTPPSGCAAPCFMGIRPGVTTAEEGIAILQTHEWVAEVSITSYSRLGVHRIEWRWKHEASPMLEPERIPRSGGRLIADKGVVQYMEVLTRIRAGDAWLILGQAQDYTTLIQLGGPIGRPRPPKPITVLYADMIFIAWTDCPYQHNFWDARVELVIADPNLWLEQAAAYPIVSGTIPVTRFVHDLTDDNCPRQP